MQDEQSDGPAPHPREDGHGEPVEVERLVTARRDYLKRVLSLRIGSRPQARRDASGPNSREAAQVLGIEVAADRKRYGRALLKLQHTCFELALGESH